VAHAVVAGVIASPPATPSVLNVNVPNLEMCEIQGWRHTVIGPALPRSLGTAGLVPKEGHKGTYRVEMDWGEAGDLPPDTDGGAVMDGYVSLSWLNRLQDEPPPEDDPAASGLARLLG
jgi:broad specificity polyphosphatase/5'/3'-nucleotidase SurE